jgi:hypothetical protein
MALSSNHQFPKLPKNVKQVVAFSLEARACDAHDRQRLLNQFGDFDDYPAHSIVTMAASSQGYDSPMITALNVAFRFIRYNNKESWPITASWRGAFRGLMNAELHTGIVDVPKSWFAAIDDGTF